MPVVYIGICHFYCSTKDKDCDQKALNKKWKDEERNGKKRKEKERKGKEMELKIKLNSKTKNLINQKKNKKTTEFLLVHFITINQLLLSDSNTPQY